jgi:hypothetical protein
VSALNLKALDKFLRSKRASMRVRHERGNWFVTIWRGPNAGYGRAPVLTEAMDQAVISARQHIPELPQEE